MLGNFFLANHIPVRIATVEYLTYVLMHFSHVIAKLQNILYRMGNNLFSKCV